MDRFRWCCPWTDFGFTGVVATMQPMEGGTTMCKVVGSDMQVAVKATLPLSRRVTLYFFEVQQTDNILLCPREASFWVAHDEPHFDSFFRIKELCAGIGGIGHGCAFAGASVCAALDVNAIACEHLRANIKCPVIHGSVTNDKAIKQWHQAGGPQAAVITAGFPCQPFSAQGDGLQFDDDRTRPFWAVLRATFLHQGAALILECVQAAGNNARLQAALADFAQVMGWHIEQTHLDLCHQWPMRRARWWACLMPNTMPALALTSWPISTRFQVIGDVIPTWPVWSTTEEDALRFTGDEETIYLDPRYGHDTREISLQSTCPTILHSYAHPFTACPCGCRSQGFHPNRLINKGVRGFGIRVESGAPLRFLHAQEAACLLTFPLNQHMESGRAALPMLGQSAAPLQSLWIYSHLIKSVDHHFDECTIPDPSQLLMHYQDQLLAQQHDLWIWPKSQIPRVLQIFDDDEQPKRISCTGIIAVRELLRAEQVDGHWGAKTQLFDGHRRVPDYAVLQPTGRFGPYTLRHVRKLQATIQPHGLIFVTLNIMGSEYTSCLAAGSFLFQVMADCHIEPSISLYGQNGVPVPPHHRLWWSSSLSDSPETGAGPADRDLGLSGPFLLNMATQLNHIRAECMFANICLLQISAVNELNIHAIIPLPGEQTACIVLCNGHWMLVILHQVDHGLRVASFDGFADHGHDQLGSLLQTLVLEAPLPIYYHHNSFFQQRLPFSCGTILIAHLAYVLGLGTRDSMNNLESIHLLLLAIDRQLRPPSCGVLNTGLGKPSDAQESQLIADLRPILVLKGVPEDRIDERCHLAIKKLGITDLHNALHSAQPWASLKAIASRPNISFKWVKADELQNQIRQRANSKFQIQPRAKARQGKDRPPAATLCIDPFQLSLITGSFVDGEGLAVQQIAFTELGPSKSGLAFGNIADLAPYLKDGKILSDKALGVLTPVPVPAELAGNLVITPCRFPAHYKATAEPVLIQGSLVQLGKSIVARCQDTAFDMDFVKTQTVRLMVYKDQWGTSWPSFQEKPVRALLEQIQILNLCRSDGCGLDCPKYHAPVDEILENLILDVWSRSWHLETGKFCSPVQAVMFSVMIRVPLCAGRAIQMASGNKGFYAEPRSPCGKLADEAFGVVWLPQAQLPDVRHRFTTTLEALCVCRLHHKYGIRFAQQHLEQAHSALKPQEAFINSKIQKIYRLYPLPFGTQRTGLQQCISKWSWSAKVLNAVGGGPEGAAWEVGSAQEPPSAVMQCTFGDVTVTLVRQMNQDPQPAPLLASSSTKAHIRSGRPEPLLPLLVVLRIPGSSRTHGADSKKPVMLPTA